MFKHSKTKEKSAIRTKNNIGLYMKMQTLVSCNIGAQARNESVNPLSNNIFMISSYTNEM